MVTAQPSGLVFAMDCISSDSDGDLSETEVKEYEDKSYEDLVKGNHTVKNADGTLRCPFCRGKKKQDYKYKDLLQHASGAGAGKRKAETTGCHRALETYLKTNLANAAEPQKQRTVHLEQEAPQRPNDEELIVWPWMGIIANINRVLKDGKYIGPGNGELRERFAGFRPIQVNAIWSFEGHQGKAVLEFNKDWQGYNDAISFERSFIINRHSRKDYFEQEHGHELYGWVARAEDYNSGGSIAKYLRSKGDLKTVAQINNEDLRKKNKLVEELHNTIQEKNKHLVTSTEQLSKLEFLIAMTKDACQKAEEEKHKLEAAHREELRKIEQEVQDLLQNRNEDCLRLSMELAEQMNDIEEKRKKLEKQETQNDMEKKKLEEEKKLISNKIGTLQKANELQRSQVEKQRMLIEKHEKQKRELSIQLHQETKKLADRQKLELEIERLAARIETMKQVKDGSVLDHFKQIEELQKDLNEKNEEMESLQDMNQQLMNKEREANDELQEARKAVIEILQTNGSGPDGNVIVKRMGELVEEPWIDSCKKKFKLDDWQLKCSEIFTLWTDRIRDSNWYPFKIVEMHGKAMCLIDESDEKLQTLHGEMGDEVYNSVVVTLEELIEYNGSGRYPVPELWHAKDKRRATLSEAISMLFLPGTSKRRRTRQRA